MMIIAMTIIFKNLQVFIFGLACIVKFIYINIPLWILFFWTLGFGLLLFIKLSIINALIYILVTEKIKFVKTLLFNNLFHFAIIFMLIYYNNIIGSVLIILSLTLKSAFTYLKLWTPDVLFHPTCLTIRSIFILLIPILNNNKDYFSDFFLTYFFVLLIVKVFIIYIIYYIYHDKYMTLSQMVICFLFQTTITYIFIYIIPNNNNVVLHIDNTPEACNSINIEYQKLFRETCSDVMYQASQLNLHLKEILNSENIISHLNAKECAIIKHAIENWQRLIEQEHAQGINRSRSQSMFTAGKYGGFSIDGPLIHNDCRRSLKMGAISPHTKFYNKFDHTFINNLIIFVRDNPNSQFIDFRNHFDPPVRWNSAIIEAINRQISTQSGQPLNLNEQDISNETTSPTNNNQQSSNTDNVSDTRGWLRTIMN